MNLGLWVPGGCANGGVQDAMTADVPKLPWIMIKTISQRITAEIPEVTHVALSVSDKPPSTIELA